MNPVLDNPWVPKMPNNFQGREWDKPSQITQEISLQRQEHCKLRVPRPFPMRQRVSKATITKIYADQLHPQYPNLRKYQVKAALVLSDNNMHESRLILDMKQRFEHLQRPLVKLHQPGVVNMKLAFTPQPNEEVHWIKTERGEDSNEPVSSTLSDLTVSQESMTSSVYDFSDTQVGIEPARQWLREHRTYEKPPFKESE